MTDHQTTQATSQSPDFDSLLNAQLQPSAALSREQVSTAVTGVLAEAQIAQSLKEINALSDKDFEEQVLNATAFKGRANAKDVCRKLGTLVKMVVDDGPLLALELELNKTPNDTMLVGVIAQNRAHRGGVWGAEHHREALRIAQDFSDKGMPIVTFIDTPGADAGEEANDSLQAHAISALIAKMYALNVPTLGVVLGAGYSGGALPLAATNLLLAVKDALFNTIQPQGLASIARKQKLSWQACARVAGSHALQLYQDGYVDAVVDYDANDNRASLDNLRQAIFSAFDLIEAQALAAVAQQDQLGERYQQMARDFGAEVNPVLNRQYSGLNFPSVVALAFNQQRQAQTFKRLQASTGACAITKTEPQAAGASAEPSPRSQVFETWLAGQDKVIYDSALTSLVERFESARESVGKERNALINLVVGTPAEQFDKAVQELSFELVCYLYNRWKVDASDALAEVLAHIDVQPESQAKVSIEVQEVSIQALITHPELRSSIKLFCEHLIKFDALYDAIISQLELVAAEAQRQHELSKASVANLLSAATATVNKSYEGEDFSVGEGNSAFEQWLAGLPNSVELDQFLLKVESWKQLQHSRISETLFTFITHLFDKIIPRYINSNTNHSSFDGSIRPTWIGRRKDFWYRLGLAYCDLQIHRLQREAKRQLPHWQQWVELVCDEFEAFGNELTSTDPRQFPGFAETLHSQRDKGAVTSGLITGLGRLKDSDQEVGLIVSNQAFQAGAIDMASGVKTTALLQYCRERKLPVVALVSSGGMQTKEGAGALFSMGAVNSEITRYKQALDQSILMVGFGDCTGGAQASFVTHPDAETWYVSGANIPFAGQIVVPSYLPTRVTLANYLIEKEGAMAGLIQNPFSPDFDQALLEIDGNIAVPSMSLSELLRKRIIERKSTALANADDEQVEKRFDEISKLIIHARGCTAVKLVGDLKDQDCQLILVQSDPDMESVASKMLGDNDEVVCLGGSTPDESYLNDRSVLAIAKMHGADALHPGIGFLSEDPNFARNCQAAGLNFIGPDYRTVDRMGNKSTALVSAQQANVPVCPGSFGILRDFSHAEQVAKEIGFPVLLKSVFGGGGKGIEVVHSAENFKDIYSRLTLEAQAAFGRGELYLERFVGSMRHIEVQIIRDRFGNCKAPGIRDCSVQRNNQKIFEESGSTLLPENLRNDVIEYAINIANTVDYVGVGTVEFIYDLGKNAIYFMEMNTRLQVEHPVTEKVSGLNIVATQFDVANGRSIENISFKEQGYAIEARVNAERVSVNDGQIECVPSPGLITKFVSPEHDNIQVISTVAEGSRVEPYYDSLIMQVIATGKDRNDAVANLLKYLSELVIEGVQSNLTLLTQILQDDVFLGGDYDTGFLLEYAKRAPVDLFNDSADGQATSDEDLLELVKVPGSDELKVFSPVSGIFYSAASPDDAPYVSEGDVVDLEKTLCLFEAMKMFRPFNLGQANRAHSEIYSADKRYKIAKVNVADGQQVDPGDLLFVVSPQEA